MVVDGVIAKCSGPLVTQYTALPHGIFTVAETTITISFWCSALDMLQTGLRRQHDLPIFINLSSGDDNKNGGDTSSSSRWAGGYDEDWRHFNVQEQEIVDEPVYPATATHYHYQLENETNGVYYGSRRDTLRRHIRPYTSLMIALVLIYTIIWRNGILTQVMRVPHNIATAMIPSISHALSARVVEDIMPSLPRVHGDDIDDDEEEVVGPRPSFVYEHPYVSSSYYTSTKSIQTLLATQDNQVVRNLRREAEEAAGLDSSSSHQDVKTRLAIIRPFCEFDAEALPTTFTCWNALPPCKAASDDVGGDDEDDMYEVDSYGELVSYKNSTAGNNLYDHATGDRHLFDLVGSDAMKNAKADVFLFYSQTFSENDVAIKAVDAILDQFFEPGGWSQCFDNIYAIEANIPQELDLYIPSAQEELYNWVNGPNRQFEAAFRIIQSGEWGEYDGFYLMEGDSVPIKAHWLDVVLSEIEVNRPFATLGA